MSILKQVIMNFSKLAGNPSYGPVSVELPGVVNIELLHVLSFSDDPFVPVTVDVVPVQLVRGDLLQFEDQLSHTSHSSNHFLGILRGAQEYCRGLG